MKKKEFMDKVDELGLENTENIGFSAGDYDTHTDVVGYRPYESDTFTIASISEVYPRTLTINYANLWKRDQPQSIKLFKLIVDYASTEPWER